MNAELDATLPDGKTKVVQIGAGCFVEAETVETFTDGEETYADIRLSDGSVIYGVLWHGDYWENHGTPQFEKQQEELDDEQELEPASEEDVEEDE